MSSYTPDVSVASAPAFGSGAQRIRSSTLFSCVDYIQTTKHSFPRQDRGGSIYTIKKLMEERKRLLNLSCNAKMIKNGFLPAQSIHSLQ